MRPPRAPRWIGQFRCGLLQHEGAHQAVNEWMKKNRPESDSSRSTSRIPRSGTNRGRLPDGQSRRQGLVRCWINAAFGHAAIDAGPQGVNISPLRQFDLGLGTAREIAKGGPLKGDRFAAVPTKSGRCRGNGHDEGAHRTDAARLIGVQSLPVVQSTVLAAYKTRLQESILRPQLADACKKAKPACG